MAIIKYVNHASVLIQDGDNFILTDPWYEKAAFGSWLPTPPASIHPAYLLALAKDNPRFSIAISHGHDDHIDDDFLSLFPKQTRILIPEYSSKGFMFRVKNKGFENVIEVPMSGYQYDGFKVRSYINMEISRDDGILTFESPNIFVVHANDNWQEIVGENFNQIKKDTQNFTQEQMFFMSQCNLADGFPNVYRDFTEQEKKDIHTKRVDNIIEKSLLNASNLGIKYFLNYAGHASAFVRGREDLRKKVSFKSNKHIQDICDKMGIDVDVLDMIPGDSVTFGRHHIRPSLQKQFDGVDIDVEVLKEQSFHFYEQYGTINQCDSYKNYDIMTNEQMKELLNEFLFGFSDFVMQRVERTKFNKDIVGHKVIFSSEDESASSQVIVGGPSLFEDKTVHFYVQPDILSELLSGRINWENLYIGYAAEVETTPKDLNARAVIRWMAMYGYVYQRNQRLKNENR